MVVHTDLERKRRQVVVAQVELDARLERADFRGQLVQVLLAQVHLRLARLCLELLCKRVSHLSALERKVNSKKKKIFFFQVHNR